MDDETFPDWLNELFLRFAAIYEGLWLYDIKTMAGMLSKKLEWYSTLSRFDGNTIHRAIDLAKIQFAKPPSIKEFYDLCNSAAKQLRERFHDELPKLTTTHKLPPSPLLADYMAKNPRKDDDPFKLIYEKYKGQGQILGTEMIKEIRRQLGVKNVKK